MQKKKLKVHFNPDNVDIMVFPGENLLQAAIAAGVRIYASCGGHGTCGTCKVRIEDGEVATTRTGKITDEEFSEGIRQACQSQVKTDVTAYVPVESRLEKAIITSEQKKVSTVLATGWRFKPPLSKYFVELPSATPADNTSDLSRLLRGLKQQYNLSNMTVDIEVVEKLSEVMRKGKWAVTVTTLVTALKPRARDRRGPRLINVEAGDTREKHYGLAFDIGTTGIKGQLLDLNRGKVLAEGIAYNGQISYGEDVITRIAYCQKPGGLNQLHQAGVDTINEILKGLLAQARVARKDIGHMAVAGNTTITHILLGLNPKYLRLAPYTPVANLFPPVKARSLGIDVREHVYLFTFPAVASYVGGDIVSGIVGAGVYQRKALTLFIDIGTNGEIVVGNSDWMATASCSAGPAFEGGGIKHGIIASDGAIQEFSIDPKSLEPKIGTIGDLKARGICGSGLINIVAALLEAGIIDQNGKFDRDTDNKRVRESADGYEYVVAQADETETRRDIVITEVDIDNLMRAKAAIYAGYQTLTNSVGVNCCDNFELVIIAGAFGSRLNIEKAITIGLLPELPEDRFVFIGNGSLLGARMTSFSTDLMDDARRVAGMMTNFELSESADFMNNYVAALFLPHTDADNFPEVVKRLSKMKDRKSKQRIKN